MSAAGPAPGEVAEADSADGSPPACPTVLKFGGTSLATPDRVQAVAAIVARQCARGPTVLVVSAFGGVTDRLVEAARAAETGGEGWRDLLEPVERRHRDAVEALAPDGEAPALDADVTDRVGQLADLLRGVSLVGECSPRTWASIMSFGERLSAPIVAAALRRGGTEARWCDARDLIVTDADFGNAWVDTDTTRAEVRRHFGQAPCLQVVTGFIAATSDGETTTLGRSGSDYTATLLGAALGAAEVEIWTDVDGVMSADPRMVPEAFSLPSLSYDELMELSHWGARVMHPAAVHPVRTAGIPLRIRNTFNPDFGGTRVSSDPATAAGYPVRGIASINQVALMRVEGPGLQGVPGIAQRVFGALARDRISVILITQASSERSICLAVGPDDVRRAEAALNQDFALERRAGLVDDVVVEERCSVVAAVGESMREVPGISGRLFGVLGHHRINVRAIAQGSSELNISLVVDRDDEERALRAMHAAFFTRAGSAALYVAGVGRVGAAFLAQLQAQAPNLADRGTELRLAGLARSRSAAVDRQGLSLDGWQESLATSALTPRDMLDALLTGDHPARIFVDLTASSQVADLYERLLGDGIAVVTANKLAFSGSHERFRQIRERGRKGMGIFFETTVGAGLPIIGTVDALVATGDRVRGVEGLLSGTLGFLFHRVMEGAPFSQALREAHDMGFTEPDPREDLGGRDVARKLVILARVAGLALEPDQVRVEALLPDAPWVNGPLEAFWEGVAELDPVFEARRAEAVAAGDSLCYLGRIEESGASVGLTRVGPGHPCAGLGGSDNLVAITTDRYADTPLVVRGPGAGPEVTAAGVFADVLRAAAEAR